MNRLFPPSWPFNEGRIKSLLRLTLICTSLALNVAYAQTKLTSTNKKAIKLYDQAQELMRARDFENAILSLETAIAKDPQFLEAHLRLAGIYKLLVEEEKAYAYWKKAMAIDPDHPANRNVYFLMGEKEFKDGNYEVAKEYLEKFLMVSPNLKNAGDKALKYLEKINFALENISEDEDFIPIPLPAPVNIFPMQYFPVLTVDNQSLIFTRRAGVSSVDDEDIFISSRDKMGRWSIPKSISSNINTPKNEGTCTISADGRTLIFTKCGDPKGMGSCDLYISHKTGEEWSVPENLGTPVNTLVWESQPSLSADGRTLFFVTNRPGGMGKRDIWVTRMNDYGEWQKPKNLGPTINTELDEVSPFSHVNGQSLYFSSEGHLGYGGFDLFLTELKEKKWSKPVNMGYPLNDQDDQVSLFITADGEKGYYSHEQVGEDGNRYARLFEFPVPEKARVANKSGFLTGRVFDKETGALLEAQIELFVLETDERVSVVNSDPVSGEYVVVLTMGREYGLYVTRAGYLFENLSFDYQLQTDGEPQVIDIYLQPIKPGVNTVLNNIFFDFDRYELKEKSKTELKEISRFMTQNPTIAVEIRGHTDNAGSDSHNLELSINRAKSVYQFLVDNGIDKSRLSYQGYGSQQPIVANDSEANRQLNRRIEFVIE